MNACLVAHLHPASSITDSVECSDCGNLYSHVRKKTNKHATYVILCENDSFVSLICGKSKWLLKTQNSQARKQISCNLIGHVLFLCVLHV